MRADIKEAMQYIAPLMKFPRKQQIARAEAVAALAVGRTESGTLQANEETISKMIIAIHMNIHLIMEGGIARPRKEEHGE